MTGRPDDPSSAFAATARADRRRNDPIRKLSRRLDAICLEATGPLEIAAHLEDQGFNNYRVRQEYGLEGPFELAERLYALTPRRRRLRPVLPARRRPSWRRRLLLASALAVSAPMILQLTSFPGALLVVASGWLLGGHRATELVGAEGSDDEQRRVLTLLLAVGLPALALAAGAGILALLLALLWWNLAGNLWIERLSGQPRTPFVALPLLVVFAALLPGVSPVLALAFALVANLIGFSGALAWPGRRTFRWLGNHLRTLMFALAAGFGQGLLLAALLGPLGARGLLPAGLIALALAGAEEMAGWARHHLALGLWLRGGEAEARRRVWTATDRIAKGLIGGLSGLMAVLLVASVLLGGARPGAPALADAALLAFGMGLGLLLTSLSARALPALAFLVAGLSVAFTLPFTLSFTTVALALALTLHLVLIGFLRDPRRYAGAVL